MKTKNVTNVGCISGASYTFGNSVDGGAMLRQLFGKLSECRVHQRSVMHLWEFGGWRRDASTTLRQAQDKAQHKKDAPYPPYAGWKF